MNRMLSFLGIGLVLLLLTLCLPPIPAQADLGTDFIWIGTEVMNTTSIAWGDWDGDGDLDLALGNWGHPNQVYQNNGDAGFSLAWESSGDESLTTDVAWGDWDGDGDLDLAVGNGSTGWPYFFCDPNQVYENEGGRLLLDPGTGYGWEESTWYAKDTRSIAWGDWDNDGDLDLAVGNYDDINQVFRNHNGNNLSVAWESTGNTRNTYSVAWGDWDGDGDGDLDLAVGNYGQVNQVYENVGGTLSQSGLRKPTPGRRLPDQQSTRRSHSPPRRYPRRFLSLDTSNPRVLHPADHLHAFQSRVRPNQLGAGLLLPQWLPAVATNTITTSLATGGVLTRRASAGLPWPIPDLGTITAMQSITSAYEIADLDVWLAITHTYDADLDVYLRSPSGTLVELFTDVGGSGDNFDYTVLSDQVSTPITSGTAPFAGAYRPEGSLAAFNGETTSGTWTLIVTDDAGGDTGTFIAWGLRVKTAPVTYIYTWDTFASGFFGQSDDVVFRLDVHGGGGRPFQRAKTTVYSPPFHVRGMRCIYVRAVAESPNS